MCSSDLCEYITSHYQSTYSPSRTSFRREILNGHNQIRSILYQEFQDESFPVFLPDIVDDIPLILICLPSYHTNPRFSSSGGSAFDERDPRGSEDVRVTMGPCDETGRGQDKVSFDRLWKASTLRPCAPHLSSSLEQSQAALAEIRTTWS